MRHPFRVSCLSSKRTGLPVVRLTLTINSLSPEPLDHTQRRDALGTSYALLVNAEVIDDPHVQSKCQSNPIKRLE